MNEWAIGLLAALFRSTLILSVSAVVVLLFLRFFQVTSPGIRRIACFTVILQGCLLVQMPVTLPFGIGKAAALIAAFGFVPSPLEGERVRERGFEHGESVAPPAPSPYPSPPQRGRGDWRDSSLSDELLSLHATDIAAPVSPRGTPWAVAVVLLWGIGIITLSIRFIAQYISFLRSFPACREACAEWVAEWESLQHQAGIRAPVPLHVVPQIGPLLCWHPARLPVDRPGGTLEFVQSRTAVANPPARTGPSAAA